MSGLTALVLAGSRGGRDAVAAYAGVAHKALAEVGGQTMLARVVRALAALPELSRIVVCAPPALRDQALELPAAVEWLPAAEGPSASVAVALAAYGAPLLVTTADHALLRTTWLRHFLDHLPAADAVVALARREAVLAALPQSRRTWLRFADGARCGCNVFYFATPASIRIVALWQEIEAERKRPLHMIRRLGPGFALRYALGRLTLAAALRRLEELAGAHAGVVELPFGLAAVDVDKPDDLECVRALVAGDL